MSRGDLMSKEALEQANDRALQIALQKSFEEYEEERKFKPSLDAASVEEVNARALREALIRSEHDTKKKKFERHSSFKEHRILSRKSTPNIHNNTIQPGERCSPVEQYNYEYPQDSRNENDYAEFPNDDEEEFLSETGFA